MARKNGLSARQRAFAEEYLTDLNATQAAIRAGYSKRTARQIGEENLSKPDIAAAIEFAIAERSLRTEVTADRVLKELSYLSFFDIGEAFNTDGSLKQLHEMREDTRRAVAGFEVVELHDSEGNVIGHTKRVKFANKIEAIDKLMKHLGMFSPVRVKFDDPLTVLIQSVQGKGAFNPVVIDGGKLIEGDSK